MMRPLFQINKYFHINKNGNKLVIELSYLQFIFDTEWLELIWLNIIINCDETIEYVTT